MRYLMLAFFSETLARQNGVTYGRIVEVNVVSEELKYDTNMNNLLLCGRKKPTATDLYLVGPRFEFVWRHHINQ